MKVTAEPNELDKMIILTSKKKFTYTVKKRNVQVSSRLVIFTNEVCYEIVDQCTWKRLDFFPFLMSIINGFSGNLSLGPKDHMKDILEEFLSCLHQHTTYVFESWDKPITHCVSKT